MRVSALQQRAHGAWFLSPGCEEQSRVGAVIQVEHVGQRAELDMLEFMDDQQRQVITGSRQRDGDCPVRFSRGRAELPPWYVIGKWHHHAQPRGDAGGIGRIGAGDQRPGGCEPRLPADRLGLGQPGSRAPLVHITMAVGVIKQHGALAGGQSPHWLPVWLSTRGAGLDLPLARTRAHFTGSRADGDFRRRRVADAKPAQRRQVDIAAGDRDG
jgi:hypothetical protein